MHGLRKHAEEYVIPPIICKLQLYKYRLNKDILISNEPQSFQYCLVMLVNHKKYSENLLACMKLWKLKCARDIHEIIYIIPWIYILNVCSERQYRFLSPHYSSYSIPSSIPFHIQHYTLYCWQNCYDHCLHHWAAVRYFKNVLHDFHI